MLTIARGRKRGEGINQVPPVPIRNPIRRG